MLAIANFEAWISIEGKPVFEHNIMNDELDSTISACIVSEECKVRFLYCQVMFWPLSVSVVVRDSLEGCRLYRSYKGPSIY